MPVPSAAAAATPSNSMGMDLGGLDAEPMAISSGAGPTGSRRALARLGSPGSPGSPGGALSPRTPGAVSHRMPQPFPSLAQGPFSFAHEASSYLIPTFNHFGAGLGLGTQGPSFTDAPASGPGAFCYPEPVPHVHGQGLMIPGGGASRAHDTAGFGSYECHGLAGPGAAGGGAAAPGLPADDSDMDDPHLPGLRPLSSPPPAPSGSGPSKWAEGTTQEDLALWALFSTPTAGQLGPWEDLEPANGAKGAGGGGRGNGFNGGAAQDRGASLAAQYETIFRAQSDPEPAAGGTNEAPGFGYGGLSEEIDLAERLAVGGPADPSLGWPSAAADRDGDLHIPTCPSTPH